MAPVGEQVIFIALKHLVSNKSDNPFISVNKSDVVVYDISVARRSLVIKDETNSALPQPGSSSSITEEKSVEESSSIFPSVDPSTSAPSSVATAPSMPNSLSAISSPKEWSAPGKVPLSADVAIKERLRRTSVKLTPDDDEPLPVNSSIVSQPKTSSPELSSSARKQKALKQQQKQQKAVQVAQLSKHSYSISLSNRIMKDSRFVPHAVPKAKLDQLQIEMDKILGYRGQPKEVTTSQKSKFLYELRRSFQWVQDVPFWDLTHIWWRREFIILPPYAHKNPHQMVYGVDYFTDIFHVIEVIKDVPDILCNPEQVNGAILRKHAVQYAHKNFEVATNTFLEQRIWYLAKMHGANAFNESYYQEMLADDGWDIFEAFDPDVKLRKPILHFIPPETILSKNINAENFSSFEENKDYFTSRKWVIEYVLNVYPAKILHKRSTRRYPEAGSTLIPSTQPNGVHANTSTVSACSSSSSSSSSAATTSTVPTAAPRQSWTGSEILQAQRQATHVASATFGLPSTVTAHAGQLSSSSSVNQVIGSGSSTNSNDGKRKDNNLHSTSNVNHVTAHSNPSSTSNGGDNNQNHQDSSGGSSMKNVGKNDQAGRVGNAHKGELEVQVLSTPRIVSAAPHNIIDLTSDLSPNATVAGSSQSSSSANAASNPQSQALIANINTATFQALDPIQQFLFLRDNQFMTFHLPDQERLILWARVMVGALHSWRRKELQYIFRLRQANRESNHAEQESLQKKLTVLRNVVTNARAQQVAVPVVTHLANSNVLFSQPAQLHSFLTFTQKAQETIFEEIRQNELYLMQHSSLDSAPHPETALLFKSIVESSRLHMVLKYQEAERNNRSTQPRPASEMQNSNPGHQRGEEGQRLVSIPQKISTLVPTASQMIQQLQQQQRQQQEEERRRQVLLKKQQQEEERERQRQHREAVQQQKEAHRQQVMQQQLQKQRMIQQQLQQQQLQQQRANAVLSLAQQSSEDVYAEYLRVLRNHSANMTPAQAVEDDDDLPLPIGFPGIYTFLRIRCASIFIKTFYFFL